MSLGQMDVKLKIFIVVSMMCVHKDLAEKSMSAEKTRENASTGEATEF
jgi:hypothetical protein